MLRNTLNAVSLASKRPLPLPLSFGIGRRHQSSASDQSYVCGPGDRPLISLTVGQVVDEADRRFGGREGFVSVHQGVRKTFSELRQETEKLAAGFLSLGLKKGERIGIWGPNTYEWYITQLAAGKAGLILVNINPAYQPNELKYCLNKVGVKAIVSSERFKTQDYYKMMSEIMPELPSADAGRLRSESVPSLEHVVMIADKEFAGAHKFSDVFAAGGGDDFARLSEMQKLIQMDDAFNIQFTSGTTGNPKGACLSHHNIVNNADGIGHRVGYHKKYHRVCLPPPLYHCFGSVAGAFALLIHGGACLLPAAGFDGALSVKVAAEEKCTSIYGTPTMFVDMLHTQREKRYDLSSVETGIMAGSPCPQELCKNVVEEMNMKDFVVCYGLTETSPVSFQGFTDDSVELKTSTIGYPSAHVEAKVIDSEGRVVPRGTPGELCTRGYSTMLGYWEDEAKTREAITPDRWFHTGDQAVIHPNGYGEIVGRIKDMVIRGGENIYPREIEEVLHQHPGVLEASVIGVPDPRMGEELCAWIRASDAALDTAAVREFCKGKIAHFKIPKNIRFVEAFPTTITGKIQKFKMRDDELKLRAGEQ